MSTVSDQPAAVAAGGSGGGSRLRARLARVSRAEWLGWAGVTLGVLAFYITLPPLLLRTIVPSLVLAAGGIALAVVALRAGKKRVGWGAVVACVAGAFGAYGAVKSGETNLERVVVWSALLAAALRYATPLTFAALGGVTSERAGVVNIGLEGMMLTGAFFGAWGADITSSWIGGIAIGLFAGGVIGLLHAIFSVACARTRSCRAPRSTSSRSASRATCSSRSTGRRARPTTCPRSPTCTCRSAGFRSSARDSSSST